MTERLPGIFLLAAVFVIAVCGLIYELIAAALSSYLLGGSVTQFSVVIGVFLTAMGIGSFLTRFVERRLTDVFIAAQVATGLCGGFSAAVLVAAFTVTESYTPALVLVLLATGALVGLEIPLLIRIMRSRQALKLTVANVLALDYVGALFASIAFPIFFVPYLGLLRTSFVFGLINISVALIAIRALAPMVTRPKTLKTSAVVSAALLAVGLAGSNAFSSLTDSLLYQDQILLVRQTKYQRIVLTRWRDDVRLFIDGHLQFSTVDEHRYHEALVHPAVCALPRAKRALILGGGDGMTARELLKYPHLERIDLVDLDEAIIKLFRDKPSLSRLSANALSAPRLTVHINDAGKFLESSQDFWDLIILDLPDPSNLSLGRLYTKSFYRQCAKRLSSHGIAVTQATSPFYAPDAFWCIAETWSQTPTGPEAEPRFNVYPYHAYVPSFGDWGFVMASRFPVDPAKLTLKTEIPLKFLTNEVMPTLFVFPRDAQPKGEIRVNRLDDQALVKYYRQGWRRFGP
jgi:spermidine synthase